jgi:UDP-N-acetylglucosamine--N-acetylmuramyl-(pentapeptide) pyrophosphoryl-undecaprenol N-acetylglucosamine transferase
MKILLTGGGTAGHITPLLAVAQELKTQDPSVQIIYVGERGGKFASITDGSKLFDAQYMVFAGKLRRYHGDSFLRRVFDAKTNLQNLRDMFLLFMGFMQSLRLLARVKPDVILLKGGYVVVPIGLAAALKRIPFVTHDSDALPGLANRLVSRWAVLNATGMPPEFYDYSVDKVRHVGVLVAKDFVNITPDVQLKYKHELGLPSDAQLLAVTGGSLGAQRLNKAMVNVAQRLLDQFPDLHIIHQVGKGNDRVYGAFSHPRLQVLEFMRNMYIYTGAADVVVTRAGANTLAELGVQGKACIVVPNPLLTGGHQLENAKHLQAKAAVLVVDEVGLVHNKGEQLARSISSLLLDDAKRTLLGKSLRDLTVLDAADKLAEILAQVASENSQKGQGVSVS